MKRRSRAPGLSPAAFALFLCLLAACDREEPAVSPGTGGHAGTPAAQPAARVQSPERLAAELEADLDELNRALAGLPVDRARPLIRSFLENKKIDEKLVELLRREMETDADPEDMRYTRLINALYARLDRADPGGESKTFADRRIMAHPYMRGLYGTVVAGLKEALGGAEIRVENPERTRGPR